MMRAAGAEIFGGSALELCDVRLPEALFIGPDDRVSLRTVYEAERARLRIFSRHKGGAAPWVLRAEAKIFAREGGLAPLEIGDTPDAIDVDALYEKAGDIGYGFGPLFRGVQRIGRGPGALRADVRLPDGAATPIDDAALDPRVLDSCLQVIIAELTAREEVATGPLLPERIDRIVIDGPLGHAATVSATTKLNAQEGRGDFALSIADTEGRRRLRIDGLHARAIEKAGAHAEGQDEPIFVEETFVETDIAPAAPATHWTIVSAADGTQANALARALAADGKQAALPFSIKVTRLSRKLSRRRSKGRRPPSPMRCRSTSRKQMARGLRLPNRRLRRRVDRLRPEARPLRRARPSVAAHLYLRRATHAPPATRSTRPALPRAR